GETPAFQKAIAETQSGASPAFDTMQAEEGNTFNLISAGGVLAPDSWEQLLREINPLVASGTVAPEVISPSLWAGMGFRYVNRDYGLYYNTDRVKSDADLPRTRADMADPKFQGKFAVQQFVIEYQYGILVYSDRQQWLETVDKIGKNAILVLAPAAVRERLLLGEFDFGSNVQNTGAYLRVKAQDSKAPLGLRYYSDYTPVTNLMYSVRKGAKSPASATLFALWMTTPEAHAIRQAEDWYANLVYPMTDLDNTVKQQLEQSGTRTVGWLD